MRQRRRERGEATLVLVEGPSEEHELVMVGRHAGQAPDIDGSVFISGGLVSPGEMHRARVTQVTDYDLLAEVAEDSAALAGGAARQSSSMAHRSSDGRRVSLKTVG